MEKNKGKKEKNENNIYLLYMSIVDKYKLEMIREKSKMKKDLKDHNTYYGRKKYYPHRMNEWKEDGVKMEKMQKEKIKNMELKLKELESKLLSAENKGPMCAICLDDMYSHEGDKHPVSFNNKTCKKHIFHYGCVLGVRVKSCPMCRNKNKNLTDIDVDKLSGLNSSTRRSSSSKKKGNRCPKGTRKNKRTGKCEKTVKSSGTKKRCANGTRRDKKTGECVKK